MEFAPDSRSVVKDADALVLVTEWNEFRALAPRWLSQQMRGKIVVDLRNVFDPDAMRAAGLIYQGIGRKRSPAHG